MTEKLHSIILEDRKKMSLSGVNDVECFDENSVILYTEAGNMTIKGHSIKVGALNTESGEMTIEGDINTIIYGDRNRRSKEGFFKKLLR